MPNYVLKILTAGEGGVGKTTLLHRYVEGSFQEDTKMTIGVEFFAKKLEIKDNKCTLQLWDFGGQERFRFMLDSYVLGAKGALVMFDLTRIFSLKNLENWVNIVRKHNSELPILLVGTKIDLDEDITVDDDYVQSFIEQHNFFNFIKLSSKTGFNVNETFELITKKILGLI